ncbi:MAG: FliH/SctL family protein [Candidatus Eremiobacterota bacterium]
MSESVRPWLASSFTPRATPQGPDRPGRNALLALMRQRAEAMRQQAQTEAEDLRRRAYEAGLAQGREEAMKELARLQAAQARDFQQGLTALEQHAASQWDTLQARLAGPVLELAMSLVQQVLQHELSQPDRLASQVRQGLEALGAREAASSVVRVHPSHLGDLQNSNPVLRFLPDERLEPGDFMVESEAGRVDGRLSERLALICRQLQGDGPP